MDFAIERTIISRRVVISTATGAAAVLTSLALCSTAAQAEAAAAWREYRDDEMGFRVEMPGEFKVRQYVGETNDPWIKETSAKINIGRMSLGAMGIEYRTTLSVEEIYKLGENCTGILGNLCATREERRVVSGVPAREYIREADDDLNIISRGKSGHRRGRPWGVQYPQQPDRAPICGNADPAAGRALIGGLGLPIERLLRALDLFDRSGSSPVLVPFNQGLGERCVQARDVWCDAGKKAKGFNGRVHTHAGAVEHARAPGGGGPEEFGLDRRIDDVGAPVRCPEYGNRHRVAGKPAHSHLGRVDDAVGGRNVALEVVRHAATRGAELLC